MRRGIGVSILLIVLIAGAAVANQVAVNLQSIVVEDFNDNGSRWIARGSKFLAVDGGQMRFDHPFVYQYVEGVWPEAMMRPATDSPRVFGVQASFTRPGYNYIEFIPVEDRDDANGNPVPRPILIPGRPLAIDVWAWGSNYNYYLEAHVRDYRGIVHTIKLGDLHFAGWRNLRADIPNHIPRTVRFVPARRQMHLEKIVLWTRPRESVSGFHFYLDQIKVLTDVFENPFDGHGLADPDFVRDVWGVEQRQ
jgi:hypothetical protein